MVRISKRYLILIIALIFACLLIWGNSEVSAQESGKKKITIYWTDRGINTYQDYERRNSTNFGSDFTPIFPVSEGGRILVLMDDVQNLPRDEYEKVLGERIQTAIDDGATEIEIRTVQYINTLGYFDDVTQDDVTTFTTDFLLNLNAVIQKKSDYEFNVQGFVGSNGGNTSVRSIPLLADHNLNPVGSLVVFSSRGSEQDTQATIDTLQGRVTIVVEVGDFWSIDNANDRDTAMRLKDANPEIRVYIIDTNPDHMNINPFRYHIAGMTYEGEVIVREYLGSGRFSRPVRMTCAAFRRRTLDHNAPSLEPASDDDKELMDLIATRYPFIIIPPGGPTEMPEVVSNGGDNGPEIKKGNGGGNTPEPPENTPGGHDDSPPTPMGGGAGIESGVIFVPLSPPPLPGVDYVTRTSLNPIAGLPGGLDFRQVNLNYFAEFNLDKLHGLAYSFRSDIGSPGETLVEAGQAAQLASDAFFVWLALSPDNFWVNLNPNEPDRIINSELGKTDAGRILLEADFQLKKSVATLIHPDSPIGKEFWDQVNTYDEQNKTGLICFSFRQWIVPGQVNVWTSPNAIYILDAPLDVKLESEYLNLKGIQGSVGSGCPPDADPRLQEYAEELYRKLILPGLIEAVNNAPEYRDLRAVFRSRVVAEWYIDSHNSKGTALYANLIGSGNVKDWSLRTTWTPQQVFDAYVKSIKDGEWKVTRQTQQGEMIYEETIIYGGVDFIQVPLQINTYEQVINREPFVDDQVDSAIFDPQGFRSETYAVLGGLYVAGDSQALVDYGFKTEPIMISYQDQPIQEAPVVVNPLVPAGLPEPQVLPGSVDQTTTKIQVKPVQAINESRPTPLLIGGIAGGGVVVIGLLSLALVRLRRSKKPPVGDFEDVLNDPFGLNR